MSKYDGINEVIKEVIKEVEVSNNSELLKKVTEIQNECLQMEEELEKLQKESCKTSKCNDDEEFWGF